MSTHQNARDAVIKAHSIIEHAMVTAPRSLQKRIGPSELGNPCDRCLIHMLAGTEKQQKPAWLPWVGTAVHEKIEDTIVRHMIAEQHAGISDMDEWLTEVEVTVGTVSGTPITGHADLFHVPSGTVIDWKIVGDSTWKKVGANGGGASITYQRQAQLYAHGLTAAGYQVNAVCIDFLPRSKMSLTQARQYIAPYEPSIAVETLQRAEMFAGWITSFGLDQVLTGCAPHTGNEFSCSAFPDFAPTAGVQDATTYLGVA